MNPALMSTDLLEPVMASPRRAQPPQVACAFAPASVGNVGVGFDLLGHSVAGAGDRAEVRRIDEPVVRIAAIRGCLHRSADRPAREHRRYRAALAAQGARPAARLRAGAGQGHRARFGHGRFGRLVRGRAGGRERAAGTAAAARGAVSVSRWTAKRWPAAAATATTSARCCSAAWCWPPRTAGAHRRCRPRGTARWCIRTWCWKRARRARRWPAHYALDEFVAQSANLALVLAGCYRGDASLVREGLNDVLVEPRRAPLIPDFAAVKQAALDHRRARRQHLRRRPQRVRLVRRSRRRRGGAARRMRAAFADGGLGSECVRLADQRARRRQIARMKLRSARAAHAPAARR